MNIRAIFLLCSCLFGGCTISTECGIGGTVLGRTWAVQAFNMPFLYGHRVRLVNDAEFAGIVTVAATRPQFFPHADKTVDEFLRNGESGVVKLPGNYTGYHSIEVTVDVEFWDFSQKEPARVGIVILHGHVYADRPTNAVIHLTRDMICTERHHHRNFGCWNRWASWGASW